MRKIVISAQMVILLLSASGDKLAFQAPRREQSRSVPARTKSQNRGLVSPTPPGIQTYLSGNHDATLREVWRQLGIHPDRQEMTYDCDAGCEAFTFPIGSDDDFSVVRISWGGEFAEFYQYLVFKQLEAGWKFLGHIESDEQRYGPPTHRVEKGDGRVWLVITELQGRGSGVVLYGDLWYEIGKEGIRQVLSCPASGHSVPIKEWVAREFQTKVVRHATFDDAYTIEVEFSVRYGVGTIEDLPLFSKVQKGRYIWQPDQRKFVLDAATSDVSKNEIEAVYNIDSLTNEEFVQHNFSELLQLAENGNAKQKQWLAAFLIGLQDTVRRQALERRLAK